MVNAPSDFFAVATSFSHATMTWIDNALDETGFELQYRLVGDDYSSAASPPENATAWEVGFLIGARQYQFRLRARKGAAASAWVESNVITTPPGGGGTPGVPFQPQILSVTPRSSKRLDLTWTIGNGTPAPDGWIVKLDWFLEGHLEQKYVNIPGGDLRSGSVGGLQQVGPGYPLEYMVSILAYNAEGSSSFSEPSDPVVLLDALVETPQEFALGNVTNTGAVFSWRDYFDSADTFRLRYREASASEWLYVLVPASHIELNSGSLDGLLEPGTDYVSGVRGEFDGDPSEWTESITFTTLGDPITDPPDPPDDITATPGPHSAHIGWTPRVGADGYVVRLFDEDSNLIVAQIVRPGSADEFDFADGLDAATEYAITVASIDDVNGEGDQSGPVSFITDPEVTTPAAPSDLIAAGGAGRIDVTWEDNANNEDLIEVEVAELNADGDVVTLIEYALPPNSEALAQVDIGPSVERRYRVRASRYGALGALISSAWVGPVVASTNPPVLTVRERVLENVRSTMLLINGGGLYSLKMAQSLRANDDGLIKGVYPTALIPEPSESAVPLNSGRGMSDATTEVTAEIPIGVWVNATAENRSAIVSKTIADVQRAMAVDVRRGGLAESTYYQRSTAFDLGDGTGVLCVFLVYVVKYRFKTKDPNTVVH